MQFRCSVHSFIVCALTSIALCAAQTAFAQTTVFAYQGKLEIDGAPVSGDYDFQFTLFDAATDGVQQGSTLEQLNVTVTNGAYTVNLDFGAAVFSGADRFLEISVRPAGGSTYTTQSPRQQITSTPYNIRSLVATTADGLSATCASCVTSSQIQNVQGSQVTGSVAGSQITGTIPVSSVPAGSGNYIQNTTSQQTNSNYNISGNGTAGGTLSGNAVNATTQYNIGGQRVLSTAGILNLFVGVNAGDAITTGFENSFLGFGAGRATTTGTTNSFFGSRSGFNNTTGKGNSFFGAVAGFSNTAGGSNSFFGGGAGQSNSTGNNNSFFGNVAGQSNTTGEKNSYFGSFAGRLSTGNENAFFGASAGHSTTSSQNSFFGTSAGQGNTTGTGNSFVGTNAGFFSTTGFYNSFFGFSAGASNTAGTFNTFIGVGADFNGANPIGDHNTLLGYNSKVNSGVNNSTAIGAGAQAVASNTIALGTKLETVIVRGKLQVDMLSPAGSQQLCLNNSNRLAPCSSSLRYKTDLRPFAGGLSIINRLQPVSFTWKDGGMRDLGFGAEDVQKIEPLLVTYNAQGLVEGLKYDRISVVLVNALKEQQLQIGTQQTQIAAQQTQIAAQQTQLEEQRSQIENLKRLFCLDRPNAGLCK